MQKDSQTSPITLANEVRTSARTTSEKYTGALGDPAKHLRSALQDTYRHLVHHVKLDGNEVLTGGNSLSIAFLAHRSAQ